MRKIDPHRNRKVRKQDTDKAPTIQMWPQRTREGNFIWIQLQSQTRPRIGTRNKILFTASPHQLYDRLKLAIVECATHQWEMYGDEWDLRDLQVQVIECWRQFAHNAARNIAILKLQGRR
jgi:hypothetical protein